MGTFLLCNVATQQTTQQIAQSNFSCAAFILLTNAYTLTDSTPLALYFSAAWFVDGNFICGGEG